MDYTASDLLGVGAGFLLFALFAFAPGYTFGWLSNVFDFRQRRLATRIAAAVPLSIGLTPISAYFLWRWSLPLVWIVFGACGVICAVLLVRDARVLRLDLTRAGWLVMAIAAGWLVIAAFSLVDLQIGNRLYFPFSAHDLLTHAAFAAALARDGIPPHNPFFFAGQPAPLRYHYFWYIPCALVHLLGGSLVSARLGVIAGILWVGLGLFGIIALYLRFFLEKGAEQIERRTFIAISMLGITGLDILPIAVLDLFGNLLIPTNVWWYGQIASWVTSLMWSPHDVAALIAGLTGFLSIWHASRQEHFTQRFAGVAAGALAFATLVGASIYVGGTLAAGCALWLIIAFLKHWRRQAGLLAVAGILALALLAPFLLQLTRGVEGVAHGIESAKTSTSIPFPFSLSVRSFVGTESLADGAAPPELMAINAACLPLNYFLQLGFFFIVGCLGVQRIWRRGLRSEAEWASVALCVASLFICTFVKSTVIENNDLGWTSSLLVLFILLLWAAEMWHKGALRFVRVKAARAVAPHAMFPRLVTVTVVLGAMGTCYALCMQRAFPVISDRHSVQKYSWLSPDQNLGRRTFELRQAYSELNHVFPVSEVIQADPDPGIGDVSAEMYSDRQMVADGGNCGTTFGGSERFCNNVILPHLKPLFEDGDPISFSEAEHACREFSISALLFKDTDPVWKDKSSWIWSAKALINNGLVRVIACGSPVESKTGYTQQAKVDKSK